MWDEYVYLLGYSWPTAKIPSVAGESISLKVPSYTSCLCGMGASVSPAAAGGMFVRPFG